MNKLTLNGVEVTLKEEFGKVIVSVSSEDADVIVEDNVVWSKYEKEEYNYVPVEMREFIHSMDPYIEFDSHSEKTKVHADCYSPEFAPVATFYFEENQNKPVSARFDYIDDMDYFLSMFLMDKLDEDISKKIHADFVELDDKLRETVEKYGFKWNYSHSQEELAYGWWDIVIEPWKWNEKGFMECWGIISRVNEDLELIMDEYKLY